MFELLGFVLFVFSFQRDGISIFFLRDRGSRGCRGDSGKRRELMADLNDCFREMSDYLVGRRDRMRRTEVCGVGDELVVEDAVVVDGVVLVDSLQRCTVKWSGHVLLTVTWGSFLPLLLFAVPERRPGRKAT